MTPCLSAKLALALLLVPSCASTADSVVRPPRFVFQNSFWVDLHHFLRAEARRQARGEELRVSGGELHDEQRAAWARALEPYRDLARRSLLFDEELVRINAALAGVGDADVLPAGIVPGELARALETAAPIHRAHAWPERRSENAAWIEGARSELEPHAVALTDAVANAYRVRWPEAPILVDVTRDTGRDLAYTTQVAPSGYAGLVTIRPLAGDTALVVEYLLHEASHVVDEVLTRWVDEESARQGFASPPDLWHAILFYTAGELTRRELGQAGTFREDLERGFPAYLPALDRHWRPYLDGASPLEAALHGLVQATAAGR